MAVRKSTPLASPVFGHFRGSFQAFVYCLDHTDTCQIVGIVMAWHIDSRTVAMTPRWRADIEERLEALQAGHDDITHGRVTLTKNLHHRKDDRVAEAVIV